MVVGFIGSRDEVVAQLQRDVRHDEYLGILLHRRGIASHNARLCQFLSRCQVQVCSVNAIVIERVRQLDLVDIQIAAHNCHHQPATRDIADGL